MKQEVKIKLTLEVDTSQTKEQIKAFMEDVINTHTFHSSTYNRMVYSKLEVSEIKEEAEIYQVNEKLPIYKKRGIKYIPQSQIGEIIEKREPLGLFYTREDCYFIAVNNSTGDAWTEEFESIGKCLGYLLGDTYEEI